MGIAVSEIQDALATRFSSHRYLLLNSYIYAWESDYWSKAPSGLIYEVEIKLTKSDYRADFLKINKHNYLQRCSQQDLVVERNGMSYDYVNGKRVERASQIGYRKVKEITPNRFYYCCPEGLIKQKDLPAYAGLIWYDQKRQAADVILEAPLLHKERNFSKLVPTLVDKFYFQYAAMKSRVDHAKYLERQMAEIKANMIVAQAEHARTFMQLHKMEERFGKLET